MHEGCECRADKTAAVDYEVRKLGIAEAKKYLLF